MGDVKRFEKMIISIHQPNFLPWIGYFYKILKCERFVFLDNVQYTKNSFINRNKIITSQGELWLTVPVFFHFGQKIFEVKIDNSFDWRKKHLKTLELNYKKAPFFVEIYSLIEEVYYKDSWENISELNIELILKICNYLNIEREFIRSSDLGIGGKSTELLVSVVKKLNGEIYLSGFGGAKYQEEKVFEEAGIKLVYYDFHHPIYNQLHCGFISNLSIIDLLFNSGKLSIDIIRNSNSEVKNSYERTE